MWPSVQGCPDNASSEHCPGQSDVEYMTEFSMWVMGGSPLLVATDIRNMTAIMKKVCNLIKSLMVLRQMISIMFLGFIE